MRFAFARYGTTRVGALALVLLVGVARGETSGAGESPPSEARRCIRCHLGSASAHGRTWETSRHARAAVGCADCHTCGRPDADAAAPASRAAPLAEAKPRNASSCQPCHEDVRGAFSESRHYRLAAELGDARAPRCISCHTSLGEGLADDAEVRAACARCHTTTRTPGKAWVTAEATSALVLLRQVSLALALLHERLERARARGVDVSLVRARYEAVRKRFAGIPSEWHTFRLREVGTRSARLLTELEELHREMAEASP